MSAWQLTGYALVAALIGARVGSTVYRLGMARLNRSQRRRGTPPPPPPKRPNAVRKVWR